MSEFTKDRFGQFKILLYKTLLIAFIIFILTILVILSGIRELAYRAIYIQEYSYEHTELIPFPVSVDPRKKLIYESSEFNAYLQTVSPPTLAEAVTESNWFIEALGRLAKMNWYQNFASPNTKILVIQAGERSEEVVNNFTNILDWDENSRFEFEKLIAEQEPYLSEGIFYPDAYVVKRDARPKEVADMVTKNFEKHVLSRYTENVSQIVSLSDALTIASLLEREAYDFNDMRHIAGIIWNRLFVGMNLQLDASLQYAKADSKNWWPKVVPDDKYIDSPFNTYKHEGLPPSPIANPTAESVIAALNPIKTDCMFYFHDRKGGFHCSATYEEHVTLLKQHYGRGR